MESKVILETALHREEISAIEALILLQDKQIDLARLHEVANTLNQRFNGTVVTYVPAKKVHYTNICRADCKFCSFYRKKNQKNAFARSIEQIVQEVRAARPIRQVTLSGALNPDLQLPFHQQLLRTLRREFPNLHLHGYSPAEVYFLARRARTSPVDILRRLREAGLDSLSGDSAMILNDKLRKKISPDILRTADWVDLIRNAHRLGMMATATMLFGHVEDEIYMSEHLEVLKNLQRETSALASIEPVPFVPQGTALHREGRVKSMITPERIARTISIMRIFMGRLIRNITIDWTKVGPANLGTCLAAGANDLGGLAVDAHEIRSPGANGKLSLASTAVRQIIQKSGRVAMEREPYGTRTRTLPKVKAMEHSIV